MRNLSKLPVPQILNDNHSTWLDTFKVDPSNQTKKYRYCDPQIKNSLKEETSNKCIYCESKIGHNTPGDIEHKIPSSKCVDKHFNWHNLTIACTECNRRKNDYYENGDSFIDSYHDDVENLLEHCGHIVLWRTREIRIEICIRILELHNHTRKELISRKIEDLNNIIERFAQEANSVLKNLLKKQVSSMASVKAEYSAMVAAILKHKKIDFN